MLFAIQIINKLIQFDMPILMCNSMAKIVYSIGNDMLAINEFE